jgi:glutaredoxin
VRVELVTRQGCHLCQDAEELLRRSGVEVAHRDVDADQELFRLYDFRVPVLLVEGRVVAEGVIEARALELLR